MVDLAQICRGWRLYGSAGEVTVVKVSLINASTETPAVSTRTGKGAQRAGMSRFGAFVVTLAGLGCWMGGCVIVFVAAGGVSPIDPLGTTDAPRWSLVVLGGVVALATPVTWAWRARSGPAVLVAAAMSTGVAGIATLLTVA